MYRGGEKTFLVTKKLLGLYEITITDDTGTTYLMIDIKDSLVDQARFIASSKDLKITGTRWEPASGRVLAQLREGGGTQIDNPTLSGAIAGGRTYFENIKDYGVDVDTLSESHYVVANKPGIFNKYWVPKDDRYDQSSHVGVIVTRTGEGQPDTATASLLMELSDQFRSDGRSRPTNEFITEFKGTPITDDPYRDVRYIMKKPYFNIDAAFKEPGLNKAAAILINELLPFPAGLMNVFESAQHWLKILRTDLETKT